MWNFTSNDKGESKLSCRSPRMLYLIKLPPSQCSMSSDVSKTCTLMMQSTSVRPVHSSLQICSLSSSPLVTRVGEISLKKN